jgi:hypothetical protein
MLRCLSTMGKSMKALIRATLAFAVAAVTSSVFAADAPARPTPEGVAAHASAGVAQRNRIAKMAADRAAAQASAGKDVAAVTESAGGPRLPNAFRAYPPSCAADPLPTNPTGPTTTTQVPLYTRDANGNPGTPETVDITLWRVPCSSSGALTPYNVDHGSNAILLMRIDRGSTDTNVLPTFPLITSSQGNASSIAVRAAMEPNTVISERAYDSLIAEASSVYVLENYPDASFGQTLFNYDFQLFIDPVLDASCTGCVALTIPGYVPDTTHYPTAFQNLPIDGYMSSAYYDPAHSGEGLVVEIYDNPGNASRTIFASWYTYDANGIPFWLVAQGVLPQEATSIENAPVYYYTGGGFAGDFGSGVDSHVWGTISFSFANCTTMAFSFNGATHPSLGGPSGVGSRTWQRLSDINGLNCE